MYRQENSPLKLALITNPVSTKFESNIINSLFHEGLNELHLRKDEFDKIDHINFIDKIDSRFHSRIVLHDCFSLVNLYDINKIHISNKWRDSPMMDFILNKMVLRGKTVTKSARINSCKDVFKAGLELDEVMLGPVFGKGDYIVDKQVLKTDDMIRAVRDSRLPVMGMGGVTVQTMELFKSIGFSGLVIQSGVWKNADPVRAFVQIRDLALAPAEQQLKIAI